MNASAAPRLTIVKPLARVETQRAGVSVAPMIMVSAAFAVVFATALSFGYVEGDDAATIAYHVFGRNTAIQLPYSAWHGMMDRILSLVPAQESVLRKVAISLTATSACISSLLMMTLAFAWTGITNGRERLWLAAGIMVAIPELFYLGLVYEPSMTAFALVLAAHLIARRAIRFEGFSRQWQLVVAAIVFGIGASCRWDLAFYGVVIGVDLVITEKRSLFSASKLFLSWGALTLVATMGLIALSGYGPSAIREAMTVAARETSTSRLSGVHLAEVIGAQQTLFTPILIGSIAVGAAMAWKTRRSLLLLFAVSIVLVFPYIYSREPKMLLPMFPATCALGMLGLRRLWSGSMPRRAAVVVIALLPWLVGLQVKASGTSYGPGFQRTTEWSNGSKPRVHVAMAGGFAVPTPEGPRPLWGHGWVLFGGGWRNFVRGMQAEQRLVILRASEENLPIVQLDRDAMLLPYIDAAGWSTSDPEERIQSAREGRSLPLTTRSFVRERARLQTFVVRPDKLFLDAGMLSQIMADSGKQQAVLYFGNYANVLRQVKGLAPQAIAITGPNSGIANLDGLRSALSKKISK